jgi:hypothetical protein
VQVYAFADMSSSCCKIGEKVILWLVCSSIPLQLHSLDSPCMKAGAMTTAVVLSVCRVPAKSFLPIHTGTRLLEPSFSAHSSLYNPTLVLNGPSHARSFCWGIILSTGLLAAFYRQVPPLQCPRWLC